MPGRRGGRFSGQAMAWILAWVLIGAVVIGSNVGSDVVLGDGALRLDSSDRVEVQVRISRDAPSPCGDARNGSGPVTGDRSGGGRVVAPIETALCSRAPEGLTGAEFAYAVTLSGTSTAADARTVWALFVAQVLAILVGAYAFVEMLSLALRRSVFTPGSVVLLRVVAACVAAGGIVVPLLLHRMELALLDRFVGDAAARPLLDPTDSGPGFAPFVIVAMVLAFAEVWRRGIVLRDDVEATI